MSGPHSIWLNPAVIGLLGLLLTGAGALIGYGIRYQLDKRKELVSEVNRERRAVYQQIVEFLFGMLKDTKQGKATDTNKMVAELYRIYAKKVLYASPQVIDALNGFMEQSSLAAGAGKGADPYQVIYRMSELMAAMRTDLGLSNKGMGKSNRRLLRVLITDIDKQP